LIVLRSLLFQVLFYLWTFVLAVVYLPFLVLPRRFIVWGGEFWLRTVLWLLARTTGLTHRIEGSENRPDGPVLYAVKHQSAWDTLAVPVLIRNPAVVIKRELLWIPFYGWYAARHGMIGIDRGRGHRALRRMLADGETAIASGKPVVIFPEGTRTAPGTRVPYFSGIALMYSKLGLPVVPVALNSGLFWSRRSFLKRPGCITVRFLPPIPPGLERNAFMERLTDAIETASDALAAAPPAADDTAAT